MAAKKKTSRRKSTARKATVLSGVRARGKGLSGLNKKFKVRLNGELLTCDRYKKTGGVVRCAEFKPGSRAGGPAQASKQKKKKAGIKSAKRQKASVSVSRDSALKRNGRVRKGCKLTKRGAKCTPKVAEKLR